VELTVSIRSEIEALKRLNDLTGQLEDVLFFLKEEGLIDVVAIKTIKNSSDRPKEIQSLLKKLNTIGKIQLLEYKWNILPVEILTLLIVTDKNQKQFSFGE